MIYSKEKLSSLDNFVGSSQTKRSATLQERPRKMLLQCLIGCIVASLMLAPTLPSMLTNTASIGSDAYAAGTDCDNLAAMGVSASGTKGSFHAKKAVDNNLVSRWAANSAPAWIVIDLGKIVSVCHIDINWYNGNKVIYDFSIDLSSDDKSFTKAYSGKSRGQSDAFERYDFSDTSARYVKVTSTGNSFNNDVSIVEIDAFGYVGTTPTTTTPTTTTPTDITPPLVKVLSPVTGTEIKVSSNDYSLSLSGSSSDNSKVSVVEVIVTDPITLGTIVPYAMAKPLQSGWSGWTHEANLGGPGSYRFTARATDGSGNQAWYSVIVKLVPETSPTPAPSPTTTTAPQQYNLVVKSTDLSGNPITGPTATIFLPATATVVATGPTPLTFSGAAGALYTVSVSTTSGTYSFDHWQNGSTSGSTSITLTSDSTLTALYKVSSTSTSPPPPITTQQQNEDKFGISYLLPTSQNGRIWESKWDNGVSRTFSDSKNDPYDPEFITATKGVGSYKTAGDGILKITGEYPRLYVYDKTGAKNWKNVEVTLYGMRISDTSISWGGIQAIARSNHGAYGGNELDNLCDTRGYGGQIRYDGKGIFEKEIRHGSGYPKVASKILWDNGMPHNQWIGYKFVVRDINNGQDVKLELYMDTTNGLNGGDWKKITEFTDNGGNFGTGYTPCAPGIDPALALTSSDNRPGSESDKPNIAVYFRSDGVGTDGLWYKNASIREINPLP